MVEQIQFPADTPLNLTCGNSGPKPGVVFTHAASGAISQYGRLMHINVGTWPDRGARPKMTKETASALVDLFVSTSSANAVLQLVRRVIKTCNSKLKGQKTYKKTIPGKYTAEHGETQPKQCLRLYDERSEEFSCNSLYGV